ncbi:MAG TPA: GGDEF domain-containing protein [Methylomirabilota bacterium]|nr:GGDEF domain-containing protein [Methylomirabilota bacterium]
MKETVAIPPEVPSPTRLEEIQAELNRLERRDWWLWITAIIVMSMLTLAVVSMSFPDLLKAEDPFFQFSLNQAVHGLVGLVLLFNTYSVYQQWTIKKLRRQFSEQLGMMHRLQARAEEYHRLATSDALTGLYNRRFGDQRLEAEAARSQRYDRPLTVVAIDLNDFKQINDTYGHAAGDLVLREFSEQLNAAIRVSDVAVRMGGDEFLVILPECPTEQVEAMLRRLQTIVVEFGGHKIPVSFSAGWVGYESGETPEQFLQRADETLYADKRARKVNTPEPIPAR